MSITSESRRDDVSQLVSATLIELGYPAIPVLWHHFQNDSMPTIWKAHPDRIYFNDAFAEYSDGVIRVATVWNFSHSESREKESRRALIFLCVFLVAIPFLFLFTIVGAYRHVILPLVLIGFLSYIPFEQKRMAKHMDELVQIAGDPHSAAQYLKRIYGDARYPKWLKFAEKWQTDNPVINYLHHGKDEELKAILRGNSVHPVAGRSGP